MTAFDLRRVTPDDAAALSRNVAEGLRSYAAWAPPDWTPWPAVWAEEEIRERVEAAGFVGWTTQDAASHAAAYPAADEPGAFHLLHLFVHPARQGTGVAKALHDAVLEDVRAAGGSVMRLRTPYGNARGLAFYAREGWTQHGSAGVAAALGGLECVWLRRPM